MKPAPKPLFRPHALERYRSAREQIVLPRFASVRGAVALWSLAMLLLLLVAALWVARLPVYSSGPAVVLNTPAGLSGASVAIFLPAANAVQARPGLPTQLRLDALADTQHTVVMSVEPRALSPESIRAAYHLDGSTGLLVTRPSFVVLVRLDASSTRMPIDALSGSSGQADVQIGTRRALSLLPLVGSLFPIEAL